MDIKVFIYLYLSMNIHIYIYLYIDVDKYIFISIYVCMGDGALESNMGWHPDAQVRALSLLVYTMSYFNAFRKSTPPQNHQRIVLISESKQ